jgi:hypothetical protein
MKKLKIYMDNCCFNRPYDDQRNLINRMETEAKLFVQGLISFITTDKRILNKPVIEITLIDPINFMRRCLPDAY